MTLDLDALTKTVLSATRKGLIRRTPVFRPYATTSPHELVQEEERIGAPLPSELRSWLLSVGFGDIDEELSFRREWLARIESGELKGSARFAQDILGNFYAFDTGGRIFLLSRSEPVVAVMAKSFLGFVDELVRRDYRLVDWVNTLETQKCER